MSHLERDVCTTIVCIAVADLGDFGGIDRTSPFELHLVVRSTDGRLTGTPLSG